MENDRELLEWAAKAAGYKGKYLERKGCQEQGLLGSVGISVEGMPLLGGWRYWNPLTDDGDALRLAVKLGIIVDVRYGGEESHLEFNEVCYWVEKGRPYKVMKFEKCIDPYAATRRAIVLAAAEIGKEMNGT